MYVLRILDVNDCMDDAGNNDDNDVDDMNGIKVYI